MATRIPLPSTPCVVTRVGYELFPMSPMTSDPCSNGLGHRVQIFAVPTGAPLSATPMVLAEVQVAATAPTSVRRSFAHLLPTPASIPAGSDVVVSLEMVGDSSGILRGTTCGAEPGFGTNTFWSNAMTTPYAWASLTSLGINAEFAAWVSRDP
jgi:hypothetical protein